MKTLIRPRFTGFLMFIGLIILFALISTSVILHIFDIVHWLIQ